MMRILQIAWREFQATAITKGFIFGAFVVPILMIGLILVLILLMAQEKIPEVKGEVAIVDSTELVAPEIAERLSKEALLEKQRERAEAIRGAMSEIGMGGGLAPGGDPAKAMETARSAADASAPVPDFDVRILPPDAEVEEEKAPLRPGSESEHGASGRRLALLVIDRHAVERPSPDEAYGAFEFFIKPKLDDRVADQIRDAARDAIREQRIRTAGLDPGEIAAITSVDRVQATEMTETGERESLGELQQTLLPFAFMFLIFIPTMMGGQFLLTTTVEEKSSRVVEILLSAVSPMQLMTGKILGQLGVGMTVLIMYGGLGIAALVGFALTDLIEPVTLLYLMIFFLIAYFLLASLFAAVGSAVNDMREAQSLQTPVMLLLMVPYILWMPITRNPNSTFSTVVSFIPVINPFAMMLRVASTKPPPTWQILLSIAIGVVSVYIAMWMAAKIFRIGLLMFGKPPNFATLVKWVRMA